MVIHIFNIEYFRTSTIIGQKFGCQKRNKRQSNQYSAAQKFDGKKCLGKKTPVY